MQPNDKPEIMWHYSYWDRPLSGLALYQGKFVWFVQSTEVIKFITDIEFDELTEDQQDSWYLIDNGKYQRYEYFYNFYQISNIEFERVRAEHKVFEQQVGKHTNHYPGTYAPYKGNNHITGKLPTSSAPILGDLVGTFSEYDILYMFNYYNESNNKIK